MTNGWCYCGKSQNIAFIGDIFRGYVLSCVTDPQHCVLLP